MKVLVKLAVLILVSINLGSSEGQSLRRSRRQIEECSFLPTHNQSFVEDIYKHFSSSSDTRILEYVISFSNISNSDWRVQAGYFQPWRWYRTQGEGNDKLLLLYHVYYGLLRPYLSLGLEEVELKLNVTPPTCLNGLLQGSFHKQMMDYLLKDFHIDPKAVDEPFDFAEDVKICHMKIDDVNGWGQLTYTCCGFNSEERLACKDIHEDGWVWALRAFLFTCTILLFLYFPALLPKGYRIYTYVYYPPDNLRFNLMISDNPEYYQNKLRTCVLKTSEWTKLKKLTNQVSRLNKDVTYTAKIKRADFNVNLSRLLREGQSPVSLTRSFFDALVRCKIRHSDPLEDCCRTPICGECCCHKCPPWHAWLRAVRTFLVMIILSLPAWPLFYAMSANGLEYQTLADEIEDMGLQRSLDFYAGPIFSKVVVGILAFMYLLNMTIVIVDGADDNALGKMYTEVLDVSERKAKLKHRITKSQHLVKKAFTPVKKYGILFIPIWLLLLVLIPIGLLIQFFLNAPMFKVLFQAFKILFRYFHIMKSRKNSEEERLGSVCEFFWFFLSNIFVCIILTIGINFLLYIVCMIIVKVLVDAQLAYRVLPVLLLLLLYIRDSFSRVGKKYASFQDTIIGSLKNIESEDLRREALKPWDQQTNKIFKILPTSTEEDADDHDNISLPEQTRVELEEAEEEKEERAQIQERKSLFLVKNGHVRMKLQQLVLFLNRNDLLYTSKKFLFHASTMRASGAPGVLEENYIRALLDFGKIAVFLLFVFLVVMAYGSAYYISPTNHLFVTLVSGLIPLILRNVFLSRSAVSTVNSANYKFEAQLNHKIETFTQSWDLHDLHLEDIEDASKPTVTKNPEKENGEATKWQMSLQPTTNSEIDLVLDISGTFFASQAHSDLKAPSCSDIFPCCRKDKVSDSTSNKLNGYNPRISERYDGRFNPERERNDTRTNNNRYSNEHLRNAVNREHREHTNDVVAAIDTHLINNTIRLGLENSSGWSRRSGLRNHGYSTPAAELGRESETIPESPARHTRNNLMPDDSRSSGDIRPIRRDNPVPPPRNNGDESET